MIVLSMKSNRRLIKECTAAGVFMHEGEMVKGKGDGIEFQDAGCFNHGGVV